MPDISRKSPFESPSPSAGEPIRILAISLVGAHDVGSALAELIRPSQNVELVSETWSDLDPRNCSSALSGLVAKVDPSLLLLCLTREGIADSEILFAEVRNGRWDLPIIVIIERVEPHELQRLISMGAVDFSLLPLSWHDLLPRLLRWSLSNSGPNAIPAQLERVLGLRQFIGSSPVFVEAVQKIPKLARCDASVFITGETGTGKEMCARAIHHLGPRSHRPFIPVNCGAIPSDLVENELFGHNAGAFTGASCAVRGLVHDAEGGTLFLDEIDSLPLQTQVKFLRFLQDQEYRPLGARTTCQADIRVIAASNADLETNLRDGKFRSDLFFRLNILPLRLPSLRERREDIPVLARHFAAKYAAEFTSPVKELSLPALEKLIAYEWPGNIRELENIIQRAIVLSDQPLITREDISLPGGPEPAEALSFKSLKARAIAQFETSYMRHLLVANDGNISKAARAAKKNRRAFWQLMRKHRIAPVGQARKEQVDQLVQSPGQIGPS